MHFLLRIHPESLSGLQVRICNRDETGNIIPERNVLYLSEPRKHEKLTEISSRNSHAWIIGDPVFTSDPMLPVELEKGDLQSLISGINGHFIMIIHDRTNNRIRVTTSLFSILPVYYSDTGDEISVSDEPDRLAGFTGKDKLNKRFILENILFYYPLFNQTIYQDILLLPALHVLEISRQLAWLNKHTELSDWFGSAPLSWKRSADQLSSLFLERVKSYLPGEYFIHALTGGFDSRTLVACSLFHQAEFGVYGFGNDLAEDILIGKRVAEEAGLEMQEILLDEHYVERESLQDGLSFVEGAHGMAGYARAHYLYAAKRLEGKTRYLITGNFGSELFRAAHNAGAVISPNLYKLFESDSPEQAFESIERSVEFSRLNRPAFRKEWNSLKADILSHPVFSTGYKSLSRNQRFYLMVMEESFRKYFGAEMMNQFRHLNNRTPFLDYEFLRALFKTEFAGVFSEYRESNPLKRFKGQVLYAHIIRKACPQLGRIKTNKGYRPDDLLSLTGKGSIALSYFNKRFRPHSAPDPNSVDKCAVHHMSFFQEQSINENLFNKDLFERGINRGDHSHDFIIALSQSWNCSRLSEQAFHPI